MTPAVPTSDPSRQSVALRLVVRHYLRQMRRDARVVTPALLLPGLGSVLVFYVPAIIIAELLARFADGPRPSAGTLMPWVLGFGGIWLAGEILWRIAIFFLNRADSRGIKHLYVSAMDELLAKDLPFFHDNFAGSLTKRAISYAKNYEHFVDIMAFEIVHNVVPLIFVTIVLWTYSPWLILALLAMLLITFFTILPFIKRRQRLVDVREESATVLSGHIADSISNMEAVRAFAREREEAAVHEHNVNDWVHKAVRSWDYQNLRIDSLTSPLYVLTNMIGLVLALAVGGEGILTLQAVFITFNYYGNFTRVMWEFNRIYRNLESTLTEAAKFTELLLEPPKITDPAPAEPLAPVDTSVEFRNVTFGFSSRATALFRDFDLRVEAGEKVGLVGRSGGGKTTLTRLLLRFMDVQQGAVLVGGQDVARITQADLRSMIAYVPQDPAMFHRSIADNIRFGRPEATDEEVHEAARLAHASEFIEELPLGYATLVGERGVKLSGGQRQRMAIARAIVKAAPILVLDEATSSLDSESEGLIQDALWRLMEDRTAIVIAHRLSTVRRMDRLIVLDQGEIAEQGTHDELLGRGGIYAGLWNHQSGGFLAPAGAGAAG